LLRYIPEEPTHVPEAARAEAARVMLQEALGGRALATVTEGQAFVDPGPGLVAIRCPACSDHLGWQVWKEHMRRAGEGGFAHLELTMPCCGAETSLHDLDYDAPAGFARFVLEVQQPEREAEEAVDLDALERTLGCMVRRIEVRG
jgi:hypothetical protein